LRCRKFDFVHAFELEVQLENATSDRAGVFITFACQRGGEAVVGAVGQGDAPAAGSAHALMAFRQGLATGGYEEGRKPLVSLTDGGTCALMMESSVITWPPGRV